MAVVFWLLLSAVALIVRSGTVCPRPEYPQMVAAAERFEAAVAALRERRAELGLPLDGEDRLGVGLIGAELTPITTTLGHAPAKRTAQTSDMAALCVRLLSEAGIGPGDRVGACMSGSFPGQREVLSRARLFFRCV